MHFGYKFFRGTIPRCVLSERFSEEEFPGVFWLKCLLKKNSKVHFGRKFKFRGRIPSYVSGESSSDEEFQGAFWVKVLQRKNSQVQFG